MYKERLNVALIGTRGVPANYGGFETCVEELGRRLVERGHSVTVYCRSGYYREKRKDYLGMKLVYLPHIRKKSLDTLSHTFLSVIHAVTQPYDVLMVFNAANSPALILPRLLGKKLAINTDGLEWKRAKWGKVAQRYYKLSEWLSTVLANRIVADSPGIEEYYKKTYSTDCSHIAYGAYLNESRNPALIKEFSVEPNGYFLQITRLEPENNPLLTVEAFKTINSDKKLVIVGDVPYESDYSKLVKEAACENIILPGYIYNKDVLNELWCNCLAYIHGNEVGGTNPALLQTMASGCFTIAIDVSFSRYVLNDSGIYYKKNTEDLADKMRFAIDNYTNLSTFKQTARQRIKEYFCWEKVTDEYEAMFRELVDGRYPWRI